VVLLADDSPGFPSGAVCACETRSENSAANSPCSGIWTVERVRLRVGASAPCAVSIGVEVPRGGESLTRFQRLFLAGGSSNEELMGLFSREVTLSLTGLSCRDGGRDLGFCADVGISTRDNH
jgi:hypothetical protein